MAQSNCPLRQFRALDFARLKKTMARPVLVDLRNIYRPEEVARHGFAYEGVGRKTLLKIRKETVEG